VRREWPQEALVFHESVRRAFAGLGGVDAARSAEADPSSRVGQVLPVLEKTGLVDLDPLGDADEAAAVALAVREAGAVALPWPLVHQLAVPPARRGEVGAVYLAEPTVRHLDHVDVVAGPSYVVTADGALDVAVGARRPVPLDPFAVEVEVVGPRAVVDLGRPPGQVAAVHHLLDAFWVSGAVRSAVRLAVVHARDRQQFGVPIARFGEIRTHLADIVVARDGLEELTLWTWWRLRRGEASTADVLALRLQALEAATLTLGRAHQVLAAMGLCEEHDLTVLDRHLQPVLRRPGGVLDTTRRLATALPHHGFDAVYPVRPWHDPLALAPE
jgi:acyl-CoA dehydrogenase